MVQYNHHAIPKLKYAERTRSRLESYSVAVFTVVLALLLTLLLEPLLGKENPFILFFAAATVSAWYGGLESGLLAIALAALVNDYFFLLPTYAFKVNTLKQNLHMGLFVMEGVMIVAALHAASQQAEIISSENQRFQRAILDAPCPLMIHAEDGEVLQINKVWTELTGYDQSEILTTADWTARAYGQRKDLVKADIDRLYNLNQRVNEGKYTITTSNGEIRIWDFSSAPLGKLPDGRQLVISMAMDITSSHLGEKELRVRERQQAAVAKLGQLALADADLSIVIDEAVTLVAQSLEVEYSKVLELLPDGNALQMRAGFGWHSRLVGQGIVGTGTDSQAGYTLLSSEPVIVEDLRSETRFSGPPLLYDHGVVSGLSVIIESPNRIFGVLGAHTTRRRTFTKDNIYFFQTMANVLAAAIEHQRAKELLLEQSRLAALDAAVGVSLTQGYTLRDILQQCTEAIVRHLNAAFARIWTLNILENVLELQASAGMYTHIDGHHSRVPVGQLKIGLIAQELKPHFTNNIVGDPLIDDQEWALREGIVAFAGYPLIVEEQIVGVMAVFAHQPLPENTLRMMASVANAISLGIQRKQAESALERSVEKLVQLNRVKDDFLSTVSHELRTPVTNMKMAIHMLKTPISAQQQERYLEILNTECEREAQLIDDLLDLQRLEATSFQTSLETMILQDWLPRIIEPFQFRTQSRQQTLQVDIPSALLPLLLDWVCLERILAELLNNACKYTPAGGKLTLSVRYDFEASAMTPSSPPVIIFSICNEAEIPTHELPHIFEKFYRVNNAECWKQRGTGLGLALVQKLVEQLQGTISVESSRGWTAFNVQLPNQPRTQHKP